MIESQYANKCKPAHRLELYFNPGAFATRPWAGVRYNGGQTCEIVTDFYANPVDAADALLDADDQLLPLWVPDYLKDQLVTAWQLRGIDMYRNEVPFEACAHEYIAQGWKAAYYDDVQPLAVRGWPVGEAVYA